MYDDIEIPTDVRVVGDIIYHTTEAGDVQVHTGKRLTDGFRQGKRER